ncbi:alanyl-tRNA synthetase [Bacillus sp. SA1-12]|uniref:serine-tRNA(Ala) deacylase AlaX n=1 Tax=Bacillus sp. SA1-12 TaxID=1455638 RepID=UPI0006265242|nr:serine-tRNA(Ala) deacylase AlaX [Bacillus sp. SA1-12]KKI94021.1 alanyl-tRNA synthetase [Bacillus sp. SA1-12]
MVSEKLYYQDSYLRSFTTKLARQDMDQKGRYYAVLDKTAFYPTGGGQPHDIGTINGVNVLDVEEIDGEIRHFIEVPLNGEDHVTGELNWERRFDHMQQHAGQHILSAAFENKHGFKTVSFHLGNEICTIDLEIANLTEHEARTAEEMANHIIIENRPIESKWVTEEELSKYSLRKELSVSDDIRLVIIPDFDYNGCGGTHPASTGQVSSISILNWEKQKKNIRVHFVCGDRVLKQLREKQRVIQGLTTILNAPQEKMKEAADRLLQNSKRLEKEVEELTSQLIEHEAIRLIDKTDKNGGIKMIKSLFKNRPISDLQPLARMITAKNNECVVLFVTENESKLQLVCSSNQALNMNQLVKKVLPLINGKGGGNESFAQGGGEKIVTGEHLLMELERQLQHELLEQ